MNNVRANDQTKTESFIKDKEKLLWSDSNSLASFITRSATYVKSQSQSLSSQDTPSSTQEISLCKVCGDKGSGKHYGQITCEGCKSFFKRSIRRKFDYTCRYNKQCRINIEQRNHCQFCRLLKCLKIGMKKDAVQDIRISKYQSENTENTKSSPLIQSVEVNSWHQITIPEPNLSIKDVLDSLLQAENAAPIIHVDNFYNQCLHILYSIVNWSKKLIYADKISSADTLLLIQNSWCQLFILNFSLCGLTTKLFGNSNSSTQSFLNVQSQLLALSRLPMDAVEYGCLKAIIFFNPDTPLLFNSTLVDKAQESIQLALESHVSNSSSNKSRFGRILLRVPNLQRVTSKNILEIFFNEANESFEKFINELFHKLLSITVSE